MSLFEFGKKKKSVPTDISSINSMESSKKDFEDFANEYNEPPRRKRWGNMYVLQN